MASFRVAILLLFSFFSIVGFEVGAGTPPNNLKLLSSARCNFDGISSISINADGTEIAVATQGSEVLILDAESLKTRIAFLKMGTKAEYALNDKLLLISEWNTKGIKVFNVQEKKVVSHLDASPFFHGNSKKSLLAYCVIDKSRVHHVCLHDLKTMAVQTKERLSGDVNSQPSICGVSDVGVFLIQPLDFAKVSIWEPPYKNGFININIGKAWIQGHVASKRKHAALGLKNNNIEIWDYSKSKLIQSLVIGKSQSPVVAVQYSPNEEYLAAINSHGEMGLFRTTDYRLEVAVSVHDGSVNSFAFFPDSERIATGGEQDGLVKVWRIQNSKRNK